MQMRLSRPVLLLESCFTDTPVLIGYLRPVILMPLGCLTGLPAAQIECILVHELGHVGRHDYLVNLLQSLVEGLLFYHPAVWWVSGVIRTEREHCCDDRVVATFGDARTYAATLAALEHRRTLTAQAALAATGGNLMIRIHRLLHQVPTRSHHRGPGAFRRPSASLICRCPGRLAGAASTSGETTNAAALRPCGASVCGSAADRHGPCSAGASAANSGGAPLRRTAGPCSCASLRFPTATDAHTGCRSGTGASQRTVHPLSQMAE